MAERSKDGGPNIQMIRHGSKVKFVMRIKERASGRVVSQSAKPFEEAVISDPSFFLYAQLMGLKKNDRKKFGLDANFQVTSDRTSPNYIVILIVDVDNNLIASR